MLPGFRFLFVTIVLSVSVLVFGLGVAALLRAARDNLANLPSPKSLHETSVMYDQDTRRATLALMRVETVADQHETIEKKVLAAAAPAAVETARDLREGSGLASRVETRPAEPAESAPPNAVASVMGDISVSQTSVSNVSGSNTVTTDRSIVTATTEQTAAASQLSQPDAPASQHLPGQTEGDAQPIVVAMGTTASPEDEAARSRQARPEQARPEVAMPVLAVPDAAKVDAAKPDAVKSETAVVRADVTQADAAKDDASTPQSSTQVAALAPPATLQESAGSARDIVSSKSELMSTLKLVIQSLPALQQRRKRSGVMTAGQAPIRAIMQQRGTTIPAPAQTAPASVQQQQPLQPQQRQLQKQRPQQKQLQQQPLQKQSLQKQTLQRQTLQKETRQSAQQDAPGYGS